jgi:hypothetical protein
METVPLRSALSRESEYQPRIPKLLRFALVAPIALISSIQFRWLIVLALRERRQSVDTRLQAGKAPVRLRLQIREHLPIGRFDCNENFIDSRKHSPNKLHHLGDLTPQLFYVPLTLFTTTVEIAHAPPSYPTSFKNCSNSPRKFSGGPLVPSLITGVMV